MGVKVVMSKVPTDSTFIVSNKEKNHQDGKAIRRGQYNTLKQVCSTLALLTFGAQWFLVVGAALCILELSAASLAYSY